MGYLNEINDEAWSEEEQTQWNNDSCCCNSHTHSLSFSSPPTQTTTTETPKGKGTQHRERVGMNGFLDWIRLDVWIRWKGLLCWFRFGDFWGMRRVFESNWIFVNRAFNSIQFKHWFGIGFISLPRKRMKWNATNWFEASIFSTNNFKPALHYYFS